MIDTLEGIANKIGLNCWKYLTYFLWLLRGDLLGRTAKAPWFLWAIPLHLLLLCKYTFKSPQVSTQNVPPKCLLYRNSGAGLVTNMRFLWTFTQKWETSRFSLPIGALCWTYPEVVFETQFAGISPFVFICWERWPFFLSVGKRQVFPLSLYFPHPSPQPRWNSFLEMSISVCQVALSWGELLFSAQFCPVSEPSSGVPVELSCLTLFRVKWHYAGHGTFERHLETLNLFALRLNVKESGSRTQSRCSEV